MARIYKDIVEGKHVEIIPKFRGKLISDNEFKAITDTQKRSYDSYTQNRQP